MAKLPGIADLGPAPTADPTRPVASIDVSPLARGAQALAQGAEAIGAAGTKLGAGIEQGAAGLAEMGQDQSRWQYSQAHADFITNKIDLDNQFGQDKNYGPDASGKTLTQRYTDAVTAQRDQSAALIQDPNMRGLFVTHTRSELEQGVVQAQSHARALGNDAATAYVDQAGNKLMDQAVAAPDDATRTKAIDAHNQLVDGLVASGAVTQVQAVQMKQSWAQQYATADILAKADSDPQAAINHLRAVPGSPDAVVNRIIEIEGQGKNGKSSASGTGQFTDPTWVGMVKQYRPDLAQGRSDADIIALKADSNLGREMTGNYVQQNTAALQGQGLPATPGNIYLSHFLGPGGAAAVLKADPNMPVQDALTKALGPDKANAMIAANPKVLGGQLVGSVKEWADGMMGGQVPGKGSIYDMIRPDVREQLLAHAQTQLQKQNVSDLADFKAKIEDSQAEANRTGNVTNPLTLSDFVGHLGADLGPKTYQTYQANVQVGKDAARIPTMNPDQMSELITSYAPKPGPGFEAQAERQDELKKAAQVTLKQRADDPGGYAVQRLPGTQAAYKAYQASQQQSVVSPDGGAEAQGVQQMSPQAAARKFAATTMLEQQHAGIAPGDRQILPQADVDHLNSAFSAAATSDDPKARGNLIAQIKQQAQTWGDAWPDVVRQLSPQAAPIVKAIAAGADETAMTRLLSLGKDENPAKLLQEQNETKASEVRTNLNTAMAPLLQTMVGRQRDVDFQGYYNLANKLASLYVARDGMDAGAATTKAFNDLVGNRYDFRDTYRIPKSSDYTPDNVQAGALVAKGQLEKLGAKPALDDVGGLSNATADSFSKFARDGTWVTSPHNDGLNLMYGDKAVRRQDGSPLFLPWGQLAKMGGSPEARSMSVNDTLRSQGVMTP